MYGARSGECAEQEGTSLPVFQFSHCDLSALLSRAGWCE